MMHKFTTLTICMVLASLGMVKLSDCHCEGEILDRTSLVNASVNTTPCSDHSHKLCSHKTITHSHNHDHSDIPAAPQQPGKPCVKLLQIASNLSAAQPKVKLPALSLFAILTPDDVETPASEKFTFASDEVTQLPNNKQTLCAQHTLILC